jgi:hypothetical protein
MTVNTESKHCRKCKSNAPCGNGHLYVLELGHGIGERFAVESPKGYLYVGSTQKSVEERFQDNMTRADGTVMSLQEAMEMPEDGQWKYNSPASKKIRKHYVKLRPDLLYYEQNPIALDRKRDPDRLKRRERKLARRLRNRGYKVFGDHGVD